MTSQSDPGFSQIEVNVRLGENSTDVLGEVITKVNEARFELPRDVEDPVVSNRTGGDAMMYMALLSEEMNVQQRADYAMRFIQPVLSTIEGVGEARVLGSGNFAMRIWLNPTKMAAFGVTATDVDDAIRRDNYISAAGTTRGEYVRASVDAQTDLDNPDTFAEIVVRQDGDRRVGLGDVANVELASETYESAVYSSGKETVFIAITEAPGANPLEMTARVKEKVKELNEQLPADLSIFMDADGSIYIREALNEVDAHADRSVAHRHPGDFPVPRFAACGGDPDRRDSAVTHHRVVPGLDDGVLDQPADAARDGDRDRARCGRCDRGGRERAPPHRGR